MEDDGLSRKMFEYFDPIKGTTYSFDSVDRATVAFTERKMLSCRSMPGEINCQTLYRGPRREWHGLLADFSCRLASKERTEG